MPAIDTGGAHVTPKRKARIRVPVTPDQRDRQRSPAQKASDRRVVNRTIETAQTRARVTPDQADRLRSVAQRAHDAEVVRRNVAASREKVLRTRGRGAGVRAVKRELEGKGELGKLFSGLGDRATRQTLTPLSSDKLSFSGVTGRVPSNIGNRTAKDLVSAPASVIPSAYIPIAALYEHHQGRPQRLDALVKDLKEHDPVYNAAAAGVAVVKGDSQGARQHWRKAKKAVNEHPGYALLEARGLRAPLGRGSGAAVRTGARAAASTTAERAARATGTDSARVATADALRKIGTTKRASKTLPGTELRIPQRYDRNLIGKAEQVLSERRQQRKSDDYAKRAETATNEKHRKALRAEARANDPNIIRDQEIQRAVDEHQAMAEDIRRINQGDVVKGEKELTKKAATRGGPIVSLLAQRITRPTLEALKSYRDDIVKAGESLEGAKASANRQLVGDLNEAISKVEKGKVSLDELKGIADRYTGRNRALQTKLTATGIYNAEESERRAALPHAILHEGVHRDPEYLAAQEKAARKTARKTAKAATTRRGRALARASEHKRLTAEEALRAAALPQREPGAHAALLAVQEAAQKTRAKQVKSSATRSKKATKAAQTAAEEYTAAQKLRGSDPFLTEETITRRVTVPPPKRAPLPTRERFVADAPKASRDSPDVTVERLTDNVKPGGPGFAVESEHVKRTERGTGRVVGYGREVPGGGKVVVKRDDQGNVVGALRILLDEHGKPDVLEVAVDPAHRGQGVASALYKYAQDQGYDVEAASGRGGYTEAGANLAYKRLVAKRASEPKPKPKTKLVTTTSKRKVETSELTDALKKVYGEDAQAAIVTQRPPQRASGADFFTSGTRAPSGEGRTFSGKATEEGTFEGSPDTLLRQNVKSQALVDAFDSFKGFVQHFGLRKDGRLEHDNFDDARQIADDRSAEGDVRWTVVRAAPRGADEQLATTLEGTSDSTVAQMFNDALNPRKGDEGPWVVVPEAAVKQLQAHVNALNPGDINRFLRSFGSGVRRVILATSLPWAVGNTAEAGFRSILHGVGPRSWITGHAVLKEAKAADPEMAKALRARSIGGGHYALADRTIHSNVDAYRAGWMKDVMSHAETLRGLPVAKQASWLWDRWTHHVFQTVNKTIEQQFQTAMLGKAVRHDLMDGELRKTFNKAANQRAAGKALDPNTASALGREVDRMYGKYSKFDPDTRALIAQYTPFLAWTRNALHFLATAPRDLPGATGTAAALVNATEETRSKWDKGNDLPGFLKGSIPASDMPPEWRRALGMKPGGHWRPGRFTPLGLASDPLGSIGGVVLPQWHSILNATQGLDWTGRKLPSKTGEPDTFEKATAVANAFLDETLPFLSVGKRIKGKGWQTIPQSAIGYAPPSKPKGGGDAAVKDGFNTGGFGGGGFSSADFSSGSFK